MSRGYCGPRPHRRAFVHRLDDAPIGSQRSAAESVEGDIREFRAAAAGWAYRRAYFSIGQEGLLDAPRRSRRGTSAGRAVVNLSQWLKEGGERPPRHKTATGMVERS